MIPLSSSEIPSPLRPVAALPARCMASTLTGGSAPPRSSMGVPSVRPRGSVAPPSRPRTATSHVVDVPIEQSLPLVGIMVLAVLGVAAVLKLPRLTERPSDDAQAGPSRPALPSEDGPSDQASEEAAVLPSMASLDRVLRALSLLLLAGAGIGVTVAGSFDAAEIPLYLVLSSATMVVVMVDHVLPPSWLGGSRRIFQVGLAITVVTLLVAVTGALSSPFAAGYFLIVAAAAFSSEEVAPTALAVLGPFAYLLLAAAMPASNGLDTTSATWAAFNVAALGVLAYITTVAGRQERRAREAAVRQAHFDPLTRLYARPYLYHAIEREIDRAARTGRGFGLLMLDVDDLKSVNDTYGHPVGDQVIRAVAEVIRGSTRQSDLAGRYGGDEFVVVLPETDAVGARTVARKVRADVAALVLRVGTRVILTSVSVGLVCHPADGATLEQLMASAEAAMYGSKRRGKNQVVDVSGGAAGRLG